MESALWSEQFDGSVVGSKYEVVAASSVPSRDVRFTPILSVFSILLKLQHFTSS